MSPEAKRKTVPITIAKAVRGRFSEWGEVSDLIKLAGEEIQREVGSSLYRIPLTRILITYWALGKQKPPYLPFPWRQSLTSNQLTQ